MKASIAIAILFLAFLGGGVGTGIEAQDAKQVLLDLDKKIGLLVKEKGVMKILLGYLDEDAVIIPRSGHPVFGLSAIRNLAGNATGKEAPVVKGWAPLEAGMSSSGDFGYTYGTVDWIGKGPHPDGEITPALRHYGTVWRKNSSGMWKVIGNVGLVYVEGPDSLDKSRSHMNENAENRILFETDSQFSRLSEESGLYEAFYRNMDDRGVAISNQGGPPATRKIFRQLREKQTRSLRTRLVWDPIYAQIASSRDLGFTTGHYESREISDDRKEKKSLGYYLTVWKKQKKGSWKFVFDGGNQYDPAIDLFK